MPAGAVTAKIACGSHAAFHCTISDRTFAFGNRGPPVSLSSQAAYRKKRLNELSTTPAAGYDHARVPIANYNTAGVMAMYQQTVRSNETTNARATQDPEPSVRKPGQRRRAQELDWHVGSRIRIGRIKAGLSQQDLADLVGVTYQQAHKYERGINRVSVGRLYKIATALEVPVSFFYEGLARAPVTPTAQQQMLLDLCGSFIAMPSRRHQEAICTFARLLAEDQPAAE